MASDKIMERKRVLITGIGGFLGAHFLEHYLAKTNWIIIGLDSFNHKGTYSRLNEVRHWDKSRVKVYHHDLNAPIDRQLIRRLHIEFNPDDNDKPFNYIINLASNSAVERSVHDPSECFKNNCNLICHMLEYARLVEPEVFVQISTDEVYGDFDIAHEDHCGSQNRYGFVEWSKILPSNPYAASKAAQESLAIAYWRSYEVPIILTNTMNCIGEWQDTEKFIPRIISLIAQNEPVQIYTDSQGNIGSRVYIHAKSHADAIKFILDHKLELLQNYQHGSGYREPQRFNICGEESLNNLEVAQMVADIMGKSLMYTLVKPKSARPGYDKNYLLNGGKIKQCGWKSTMNLEQSLKTIIDFSLENQWWLE